MFGNQPLFLRRSPENCFPRPPTGRLQRVHSNCSPQTWQSLLWNAVRVRISPGRLSVRHCVAIFGPRRCDDRRNRISTISDRVKSGLASVPMLLTQYAPEQMRCKTIESHGVHLRRTMERSDKLRTLNSLLFSPVLCRCRMIRRRFTTNTSLLPHSYCFLALSFESFNAYAFSNIKHTLV